MATPVTKYTLTATIGQEDIPILKDGLYKLCVAKLVNGKFNTVWESRDFFTYNTFEFTDEFQVFGSAAVVPGNRVYASTNQSGIKYGQIATLDRNGIMSSATGAPDQSGKFKVVNNYGQIYFGVSAKSKSGAYTPIYAATTPTVRGETTFTPVSKVLIFFSNELSTGTIFVDSISDTLEVDFTGGVKQVDVTYMTDPSSPTGGNGVWIVNGSTVSLSRTYHTQENTFTTIQPSPALLKRIDAATNSGSTVAQVSRALATFSFQGQDAQNRAQNALGWLQTNQPSRGVARIANAHALPAVMDQYRVQVDLGIDPMNAFAPAFDKARIDKSFRTFCEQMLASTEPAVYYNSLGIYWDEAPITIGYAQTTYQTPEMAANAARIIKVLVPPTGYHFGTLPLGQGSRVVTSYISVDKLTPLLAENDEVAKNWYNQVAPQPNMTSFTWYSPAQ